MTAVLPTRAGVAFSLVTMCALLACDPAPAGIHVTVESELKPRTDFDRLTVIAALAEDDTPVGIQTLEGNDLHLPASFNFVSGKTVREGTRLSVHASAEKAGVVISAATGEATLAAKSGSSLTLTLEVPPVVDAGSPTELCDNGVDDDGDGKADCADDQCAGKACLAGGLTCSQGRCGCGLNTLGTVTEQTSYRPWMNPTALRLRGGAFDGQVAILGGRSAGALSAAVDLVQLVNGTVTTLQLNTPRELPAVLALQDGGLLVLGGRSDAGTTVSSYEVLVADGGFEELSISPPLRAADTGALVNGDSVVLAGGNLHDPPSSSPASDLVVAVDLTSGAQQTIGQLSASHDGSRAVLPTGELLFAGGAGTTSTDRMDLVSADGGIRTGPTLPAKLTDAAVLILKDGRALILGGRQDNGGTLTASARAFMVTATSANLSLRELTPMLSAKPLPRATVLENGWVYVDDASGANPNGEWFDPVSEHFLPATNPGRVGYALVPANGPTVLLVGGAPSGNVGDGKLISITLTCQ